jgi:hypothetical protein
MISGTMTFQDTGDPIAVWRDGQVLLLPADQIELPEDATEVGTIRERASSGKMRTR